MNGLPIELKGAQLVGFEEIAALAGAVPEGELSAGGPGRGTAAHRPGSGVW